MEYHLDSKRKLASIQVIDRIDIHSNADTLELATILGWQVIVRIGEVKIGMKVIYCEIDSLLPVNAPWLPSAVQSRIAQYHIKKHFRVKTIKLRGELSQGLIIPITEELSFFDVGTDVTTHLGIKKYDPPALTGRFGRYKAVGDNFPTQILSKTDEPRVQSEPHLFRSLQNKPYYITVKLDGTSATYFIHPVTQALVVCSRNLSRKRPADVRVCPYWSMADKYQLEPLLRQVPHLALQGEICGPHIQKNRLGLSTVQFYIFNVIDIRDRRRLSYPEMKAVCESLGLPTVPLAEIGESFNYPTISSLLAAASGTYAGTYHDREGLVVRAMDSGISFKAINNDYLLKND